MHPFEQLTVPLGKVAIHWFGQSSYAIKDASGGILQVDPYFPHQRPADTFIHAQPPLDESSLRTDHVLLTHDHGDHTCLESILRIHAAFPAARYCGPLESIKHLSEGGIPAHLLTTISAGETKTLGSLTVHAVWAKPPQGDRQAKIPPPDVTHLGYVVQAGAVRVYVSGDPIHTFGSRDDLLAPIAALQPDIGLLTTHPSEGEFPFFDGSVVTAVKLKLKVALPAHYDCFVVRNYDPQVWAAAFPANGPATRILPYNSAFVYP